MMLDKMQIEKIINLNNRLNEDIGKLQIENDVLLAKNNLLQEENEKLRRRYPEGFDAQKSIYRDEKDAEYR